MKVKNKKAVYFKYRVIDEDDRILEQSDIPVAYVHGVPNRMFPDIERALKGKAAGDKIEVVMPPEKHFGAHDPSLTFVDKTENVPHEFRRLGAEAEFENDRGDTAKMTVTKIDNGEITLDGNHPFAGKTVTYIVELVAVRDASPEEIGAGHPKQDHPYL